MPELPDIEDYLAALRPRVLGARLEQVRITGFSLLKTFDPPVSAIEGQRVTGLRRLGKRLVFVFDDADGPLFAVLHLMIAGRLRWRDPGAKVPGKVGMAAFDFTGGERGDGTLLLTEAGTKKRASLHVVRGEDALAEHDRGGIDPLRADRADFAAQLQLENRTLKRALTDPRRFSGIGNAFSDEILHAARLSPVKRTRQLTDEELDRLHAATHEVLQAWVTRLREQTGDGFPEAVTAFRADFATHGRFGQPCPVCGTGIQRIRYADNETNYCPRCQTEGKLLADRSLSRLLKDDWPRTVDQLEGA
ncbi:formamidopyrimidine-DNA glycosylase [Egicoccus halophilus]|uniref:Formamidopyrimidine-DNA glycosylase n=1 Tax=Egicoccus halophilus TaxID=1670830 RepID=A0A8J3ESF2_9ACTN|nr:DNA-formamidopyrimidine glycosylase family protein [Egicoccus halophilus]GGI03090.1 formamidopyrimidine-DNA glycosylase [Egicoccus halophilus]